MLCFEEKNLERLMDYTVMTRMARMARMLTRMTRWLAGSLARSLSRPQTGS